MLCLNQKNIFALYMDDPARFAAILCPPGWRYLKNTTKPVTLFSFHDPSLLARKFQEIIFLCLRLYVFTILGRGGGIGCN